MGKRSGKTREQKRRIQERRDKLERKRAREKLLNDTIKDLTPTPPGEEAIWWSDPHDQVSKMFGISRQAAKNVNFGMRFTGMDFGYVLPQPQERRRPSLAEVEQAAQAMKKYVEVDTKVTMGLWASTTKRLTKGA